MIQLDSLTKTLICRILNLTRRFMKTAVAEKQFVPKIKVDWEKIQATAQEEQDKEKQEKEQPKEEPKDPYWKDYNEFLVNLA